jgi:hypothetical protein
MPSTRLQVEKTQRKVEPIRVLFIGGHGRSGSTLLLRLLGEIPGLVPVGEVFDIWDTGYRQNQLCGCGVTFHECPFWQEVSLRAFGCKPCDLPVVLYMSQKRRVDGRWFFPRVWVPMLRSGKYSSILDSYAEKLKCLYKAIAEVSGGQVIVDSSKGRSQSFILRELPQVELHLVHLVRDSRAAAFSWQRTKLRTEVHWQEEYLDRRSVSRSALEWNIDNLRASTRRKSLASYTMIRYEDLTSNPNAELKKICDALRITPQLDELSKSRVVNLGASHTIGGNPNRFILGETVIHIDNEWVAEMLRRDQLAVTALTALGLLRYHYRFFPRPGCVRHHEERDDTVVVRR